MQILKVRKGFATNSSSTHSLLVWDKKVPPEDFLVGEGDFGWEYFTAASPRAKQMYLAITLRQALQEQSSEAVCKAVVKDWVGIDASKTEGYIDHESVLALPYEWDGKSVSKGFFDDLKEYILRDDIIILGGNDNDGKKHELAEGRSFKLAVPRDCQHASKWCARKDSRGYWTLFDREDGTKVRLTFQPESVVMPEKADTPELVDLKITDKCSYGCEFCYMGSTHEGQHAPKDRLYDMASTLEEMRVFEVAIGGGEPTLHPDFWEIVKNFRRHGVIPNFTTRNLAWMREPEKVRIFIENCGGMAFSIDKGDNLKDFKALATVAGIPLTMLSVQYVVGVVEEGAKAVMKACHKHDLRCTLLGYKTTGRGTDFKPKKDGWISALAELHEQGKAPYKIGIDTMLAAGNEKYLKALGVSEWCYETKEGKFSMYIDAVENKCGPSSYCEPIRLRKLPDERYTDKMKKTIEKAFAAY